MNLNWNPTISFGDLVSVIAFLTVLYGLHVKNVERFVRLETKVGFMWDSLKRRLNIEHED